MLRRCVIEGGPIAHWPHNQTQPAKPRHGPPTRLIPDVDAAMIVKLYLYTDATADDPVVEACFTLSTTSPRRRLVRIGDA